MSTAASPSIPRLGPDSAGMLMTPEEFDAITEYDEDYNYELVHGVLVVTPFAGPAERSPNDLLGYWLQKYAYEHPRGSALVETLFEEYIPTSESRRRADRAVWTVVAGRRSDPRHDVPTIVIEFLSKGKAAWRRDYVDKRNDYLDAGVREYWVIDRFRRVMTVFTTRAGKRIERKVTEKQIYRTPLLPGFELPLEQLLEAADRWT